MTGTTGDHESCADFLDRIVYLLDNELDASEVAIVKVHLDECAPCFERYAAALEDVYVRRWDWLADIDLHMLDLARTWLGVTVPIVRASSLNLRGAKTDRILSLCDAVGASTYLSGGGGSRGYLDTVRLQHAGITTIWQTFAHPHYPQRYGGLGFVSHLGFLDLLFNCGPDSAARLWPAGVEITT